MDESNQGAAKRGAILAAVLIAHAAVFAALLMTSRTGARPAPQANAVELVFLAPANPPKVRGAAAAPRRSSGEVALVIAPPVPDSPSLPLAASTSSSYGGDGSGVDWAAEARRALQAFEIRRNQFSAGKSVSGRPEDENWLPNVQHRAGEQMKTANGDWIVWINSNCYEIATSESSPYAPGALPETICRRHSGSTVQ